MNRITFLHGSVEKPMRVEEMKEISKHWEGKPHDNYRREVGCFVLKVIARRGDWNGTVFAKTKHNGLICMKFSRDFNAPEKAMRYCDEFITKLKGQIGEQE